MANKLFEISQSRGPAPKYVFHCPGCDQMHGVWLADNPNPITEGVWEWNGSLDKPTINPSILVRFGNDARNGLCHSFVRDGMIQFLGDCTHALKGQTVELPDFDSTHSAKLL